MGMKDYELLQEKLSLLHGLKQKEVAIKKVLQDKRFKNRELQIMRKLQHPNIVTLKHCFYSNGDKPDELYLNLVLEYVPETVYRVARQYHKMKQTLPLLYVKLYMYQLCRALAHIHALRDAGVRAAVCGKALYSGAFTLSEAFEAAC